MFSFVIYFNFFQNVASIRRMLAAFLLYNLDSQLTLYNPIYFRIHSTNRSMHIFSKLLCMNTCCCSCFIGQSQMATLWTDILVYAIFFLRMYNLFMFRGLFLHFELAIDFSSFFVRFFYHL